MCRAVLSTCDISDEETWQFTEEMNDSPIRAAPYAPNSLCEMIRAKLIRRVDDTVDMIARHNPSRREGLDPSLAVLLPFCRFNRLKDQKSEPGWVPLMMADMIAPSTMQPNNRQGVVFAAPRLAPETATGR
eukprot:GFKZ01013727.1.p2 GENE.GFKZ01013727.1~~GFKZ01013727.1.p2  ORF type:complete len:131 (-),score=13.28 GFKZ01013727.1:629-1021(-)